MSNDFIEFGCLEITQPIGKFYIGSINSDDLVYISYADVRRIEKERDIETYLGVQRPLSDKRVRELIKYVNLVDASFPTSILITVSSDDVRYDSNRKIMGIRKKQEVAKIIDGQHRIAGLENYVGLGDSFQSNVTIFIDMDIEDQAMVFTTINLKQTKVNKSLAYDLYDFAKQRSPQKSCHNIVKFLNSKDNSPFKDKIKILGTAEDKVKESITQSTFVENLLNYVSKDPMTDRDLIKRGKKLEEPDELTQKRYIFRNLFIQEKDAVILRNIWNYFDAIRTKWKNAWEGKDEDMPGNILRKSTGFVALMKFLRPVYLSFNSPDELIDQEKYSAIINRVNLDYGDFTIKRYIPGAQGQNELYRDLCEMSGISV